jgi:hypothetical protein
MACVRKYCYMNIYNTKILRTKLTRITDVVAGSAVSVVKTMTTHLPLRSCINSIYSETSGGVLVDRCNKLKIPSQSIHTHKNYV